MNEPSRVRSGAVNCSNCGAELDVADTFCQRCGTGVEEAGAETEASDTVDEPGRERALLARRAGARALDFVIVIGLLFAVTLPFVEETEVDGETVVEVPFVVFFVSLGVLFAYEVGCVAWRGQTPGKITFSLRIIDQDTQAVPSFAKSVRRWVLPGLGFAIAGTLGPVLFAAIYATAFFEARGRNWPDKLSGTEVVLVPR